MLLSRGAISFAIHGVFTGTIARLVLRSTKHLSRKKYLNIALAFLAGIFLHSGRNLLLFFNIQRAIILSIIGVYMLLTYLLYQSESIYLKERIT